MNNATHTLTHSHTCTHTEQISSPSTPSISEVNVLQFANSAVVAFLFVITYWSCVHFITECFLRLSSYEELLGGVGTLLQKREQNKHDADAWPRRPFTAVSLGAAPRQQLADSSLFFPGRDWHRGECNCTRRRDLRGPLSERSPRQNARVMTAHLLACGEQSTRPNETNGAGGRETDTRAVSEITNPSSVWPRRH